MPLILSAFGLGIFACLAMVATVLYLARESAFRGVDFFARWSPVVSGAFIFGIALYLGAGYFG